jgi:hypothetical protein
VADQGECTSGLNALHVKCEASEQMCVTDTTNIPGDCNGEVTKMPVSVQLSVDRVRARQHDLVSRAELTFRRLRRLQSRQANSSVRQQISGLVSVLRRQRHDLVMPIDGLDTKLVPDFKSMSTSELVGLVRRMQASDVSAVRSHQLPDCDQIDLSVCPGLGETSGRLSSNLRHLESAIDSDATESSSASESDEELDTEPAESNQYVIVSETTDRMTAKLSYASERAMIASRWTWLQAQVSDLEYRIRQQSEIYRQLRSLKGAISFRDQSPLQHDSGTTAANQSTSVSYQKSPTSSEPAVGESHLTVAESDNAKADLTANDSSLRAARCRPVRMCRRRRLLRLSGNAHLLSSRRTVLSSATTLRCSGCYPPATACTLCAGRTVNSAAATVGSHMSVVEKMALLDPAFHPVLSFSPDIQLTARLADCVRQMPIAADSVPVSELTMNNRGLTIKLSKANLKSSVSAASLKVVGGRDVHQSNEMHRGYLGPGGDHVTDASANNSHLSAMKLFRSHLTARRAVADALRYRNRVKRLGRSTAGTGLKPGRPPRLSQSASSASLKDTLRRQCSSSVFDINNVVIPYSATVSRVEKLEYKEILTPKWREAPKAEPLGSRRRASFAPAKRLKRDSASRIRSLSVTEEAVQTTTADSRLPPDEADVAKNELQTALAVADADGNSMIEDLSDETFIARHLRYEIYEKKQCMPAAGHRKRSRSNRSESDHSLTMMANPRSPDASFSEGVADALNSTSVSCHPFVEPARPVEPVTFHLPEQISPPSYDCQLRRNNSSSTCGLSRTSSFVFAETAPLPAEIPAPQIWPQRTFPLADSEYEQLLEEDKQHHAIGSASGGMRHRQLSSTAVVATSLPLTSMRGSSSETSLSTVTDVGDGDDPEWTVVAHQKVGDDNGSGFCLKIAKM